MDIGIIGGADGPTAVFVTASFPDVFFFTALGIMAFFYAIYFAKMLAQKRRGIQTRQLGKRKEKSLRRVEMLLSAATGSIVLVQLISMISDWSMLPGAARVVGGIIGLAGDLLFLAAVVQMKDSWRAGIPAEDKTALVTEGIFRYSRNPAFLGFDLMYIGMLLLYFNPLLLVFTLWTVIMLHLQILQEEKFLAETFGEEYAAYKERTGRYIGRKK